MIMAVMGYMSLILEVTGMDGGVFACNGRSIFFSIDGTIGMCICSESFRNCFFSF